METNDIHSLLVDPDFLEVKRSLGTSNLFSTLAVSHLELWHSAFVKWIIDPNSEIGLGDFPLKRFLNIVLQNSDGSTGQFRDFSIGELEALDLSSVHFWREESIELQAKVGRLDIYGESASVISKTEKELVKKIRIIVENKIKSDENNEQTIAYAKWADSETEEKGDFDYDFFIFLTPLENQKKGSDRFVTVTYQQLVDDVLIPCLNHPGLGGESKYLLQQYILNLGITEVKGKRMATTRKQICEKIYKAHRDVLDEIFECAKGQKPISDQENRSRKTYRVYLDDLVEQGIISKTDTLHANYEGKHYVAKLIELEDSSIGISHSDRQFETPSSAAKAINEGREVNGWKFWEVKDADGKPKGTLAELRAKSAIQ